MTRHLQENDGEGELLEHKSWIRMAQFPTLQLDNVSLLLLKLDGNVSKNEPTSTMQVRLFGLNAHGRQLQREPFLVSSKM